MKLENKAASELFNKNKQKAQDAAKNIINKPDIEAWQCLLENTDCIFTYIKDRIGRNIAAEINKDNVDKVFELIKVHECDWDEYIALGLSKIADEKLNAKMLEFLNIGTMEEKIYASRYFCLVQDDNAAGLLFSSANSYDQHLKSNAAEALGRLEHEESYNHYIEQLKSEDEWDKIEAAQFLANYGNKDATIPILEAMESSAMSELIAGEIATLTDVCSLFEEDKDKTRELALEALDNIISGVPEVWPLRVILDFKVYDCLETVIKLSKDTKEAELHGRYAQVLLKAKQKFSMFVTNSQYTYDEEKDIMTELDEIYHLLICEEEKYWDNQFKRLLEELSTNDKKRNLAAISVLNELQCEECISTLVNIASSEERDECVICEAVVALAKMGYTSKIDKDLLISRIKDPNLLAVVENCLIYSVGQEGDF